MTILEQPLSAPSITLEDVRLAMSLPRPGLAAQALMASRERLDPELYKQGSRDCRRAAVLLLLYPHEDELYLVLTVRPEHLPSHPGQVSFPGGSRDDESESVVDTALREAYEEVGVKAKMVEPLGRLTHIYIPPSHFCIQIVVAYTPQRPQWRINPAEVSELLEVPVRHFLDRRNWKKETCVIDGTLRRIPYFAVGQHKVWGATAMALAEFVTMLEKAVALQQTKTPSL
ncbi:MAG: CoA pyrophosphatase [Chloroflexi bacterium]|nr:CoA pyrophosphatase [Chloroflexota bacterium]